MRSNNTNCLRAEYERKIRLAVTTGFVSSGVVSASFKIMDEQCADCYTRRIAEAPFFLGLSYFFTARSVGRRCWLLFYPRVRNRFGILKENYCNYSYSDSTYIPFFVDIKSFIILHPTLD